jgi:Na+/H+-dicarboxylate symporter
MKLLPIATVTLVVFLLAFYQWSKLMNYPKKEKIVFVSLTAIGWILAMLLILFPDMQGPNELVQNLCKPFAELIKE